MINLLPPEIKAQTNAARANRLLLRYNILLVGSVVFILMAIGLVYIYLGTTKSIAEQTVADNIAKAGNYGSVETDAETFRQNLANAKTILDSDVTYSKVVLEIASVLPPGIAIDTLSLDSQTFGTPTTLAVNARNYTTVLALKDSLQASTIFSNVSIQTISNSGAGEYPLSASFSVTIRKDAAQ